MLHRDYRLPLGQKNIPLYSYSTPYFIAKVFQNELTHARFGFIVSKKVASEGTTRNRVKRQLRAVIEGFLPQFTGGYDILFIIQKGSVDALPADLTTSVTTFLTKKKLVA